MKNHLAITLMLGMALHASAQAPAQTYAGQQTREIKSLSQEERDAYLSGAGFGVARAAELNHYPGPRHVLDLADELRLTLEQRKSTEESFARMHAAASAIGSDIVARERTLGELFAGARVTSESLRAATLEIGRLQADYRQAHLLAHLDMRRILTQEQIARYDELRGYASATAGGALSGHRHHQGPSH